MREIKFRGKRIDNGEWVYGYYVGDCGDGCHEICDINSPLGTRIEVDPATVGQFTGLKDKNSNEIYEGDIFITRMEVTAVVEWEKEGRFLGFTMVGERKIVYINREPTAEIIGNIYDNPELIQQGAT